MIVFISNILFIFFVNTCLRNSRLKPKGDNKSCPLFFVTDEKKQKKEGNYPPQGSKLPEHQHERKGTKQAGGSSEHFGCKNIFLINK